MRSICVYCGSSPGRLPAYRDSAVRLGELLAERDIALVYGGASVGLMGVLADTVLACGGRVTGVISEALVSREVAHAGLTELHVTRTMHQRKMRMAELADGFIALPGGIGTLEELFECWTWIQLGLQAKPCGLLNVAGFHDALVRFLDQLVAEQFLKARHRNLLLVAGQPDELLDQLAAWLAPAAQRPLGLEDA